MFYNQSLEILEEVKKAKSILLNAHRKPDLDAIGSSTGMMMVLKKMGKNVDIVCPTTFPTDFRFLKGVNEIKTVDFRDIDSKKYDLMIVLDSGSYDIVTGNKEIKLPNITTIVIDHHKSNNFTDVKIKLFQEEASATCEIIYQLLTDWDIKIDEFIATALLSGIAGDTVLFRYTENTKKTFNIINDLIQKGANKDLIVENVFNSYEFDSLKLVGELLTNMKKEKDFVWSAIDFKTFEKYGCPKGIRELTADLFFQSIKGTKFGLVLIEEEKNKIFVSLRSIKNNDVSQIAKSLGGGGHRNAAGATVIGKFNITVNNIINKFTLL